MNFRLTDQDHSDQFEELANIPRVKNLDRTRASRKKKKTVLGIANKTAQENHALSAVAEEREEKFEYTYKAGMLEAEWLYSSLGEFREQRWIDDILRAVKGGKEASVYLCQGNATTGEEWIAAKVYRPLKYRNMKNDWLYREGRGDLDDRGNRIINKGLLHAIHKRTEFGRKLLHSSWLEHEYKTMQVLHAAGVDVPKPYSSSENAILMEYFGDDLMGAPTLNDVDLDRTEARALYQRVIYNIELMLQHDRVHGDLSAFNILYWDGDIAFIDFPQAVQPEINQSAYRIFERDVLRVCEYFKRKGVPSQPRNLALQLWEKYNHRVNPLVNPKVLGEDDDAERGVWEDLKNA